MPRLDLGKYRGIIISIALFLLLDASVLMLNFYISFEIADDAVAVNLAGRQRMLSQRMTKSLLDGNYSLENSDALAESLRELRGTRDLFDTTLTAFQNGGEVRAAGQGNATLPVVTDPQAIASLSAAETVWKPYKARIDALLKSVDEDETEFVSRLNEAIAYGRANNLSLLKHMNDLTVRLEDMATAKATRLRMIQTVGISLAIANFIFIIIHFIAQLREGDRRIESARQETTEILQTVNEGLFLLDQELKIGSQYSGKLGEIFGRHDIAGKKLHDLLDGLVSDKDMKTASDFVKLLFSDKVKEKLVNDLNPLDKVQINIPDASGGFNTKYLSFQFARAYEGATIANILVTVNDISEQVVLAQELELSRSESEQQLEILTNILHADPKILQMFLDNAYASYNRINSILREPVRSSGPVEKKDLQEKIRRIFADIHNLKGEAGTLSLDDFEGLAHQFEEELEQLRSKAVLGGNDFLPLTVRLNRLIAYTESVQKLISRLGGFVEMKQVHQASPNWVHLYDLGDRVAKRSGKKIQLVTSGLEERILAPEQFELVNHLCIQLVRNAVTHGIEQPADRLNANKPEVGRIDIRLAEIAGNQLELTVRDDGQGFNYKAIRERALSLKMRSDTELDCMNNRELLSLIFEPGFSTAAEVNEDAGRGVGMDIIRREINNSGGKLKISSAKERYCEFTVTLPLIEAVQSAA